MWPKLTGFAFWREGENISNGSFTLANFVSKTVSDSDSYSDMKQYLPWPPWATRQKIETILLVHLH